MRSIIKLVFVIAFATSTLQQKFVIPDISLKALSPKGLIVTLPDSTGIQYFAFHGNVNQPIKGKEEGTISRDATRAENGVWQIKDSNIQLKVGDVINYWVFVQHRRLGFDKQDQKFTVSSLEAESSSKPVGCPSSVTTINGGDTVCKETLIFEDHFDSLDETKWQSQYYIADEPDLEFVTYEPSNIQISNGILNLVANLRPDVLDLSTLDFKSGSSQSCTGKVCFKVGRGKLLPPVIAGQIKSKFSFRYGKIEIRAQLPQGDWIFPQLYLEPKDNAYGKDYESGRIWLAYARGNPTLKTASQEEIGNNLLYCGPVMSPTEPQRSEKTATFRSNDQWSKDFHTFTLIWEPNGISVSVDGNQKNIFTPFSNLNVPYANKWLNNIAPFDKNFILTLGIAAGGHSDFPDFSLSGQTKKPWKRTTAPDTTLFYEKRNTWLPTWQNEKSTLKIDYIRVWSL